MMRRDLIGLVGLAALVMTPCCLAQQGANSAGGSAAGLGAAAGTTAGFGGANGGVNTTGFSLSSRFESNFSKYTGGSQSIGQNTAGGSAATSGVFGQSAQGATGGRGTTGFGLNSGLSSFGMGYGMGGYGMGGFGRNSVGRMGNNMTNNGGQSVLRTHLRLGAELSALRRNLAVTAAPKIVASSAARINKIIARSGNTGNSVALKVRDGRVVLTGRVRTAHDRTLAENLARLEPGIWDLENELIVDPGAPTPSTELKPSAADQPQ